MASLSRNLIGVSLLLCVWTNGFSLSFRLPTNGDNVIGKIQHAQTIPGDNFARIGRRYDIGYYEMIEANPGVNPDRVLPPGTKLVIPTRFTLPAAPKEGIVLNLAELRLYYYPPGKNLVITHPVGIGREGWNTPVGMTKITEKTKDPTWYAPESIRKARAEEGVEIPKVVPPGPENPLGGYRFRLIPSTVLIHGTNDAAGVGRRSSSGCIRMFPEDVELLYDQVSVKTSVNILNDPYKVGWEKGRLYLEAHLPLQEQIDKYRSIKPMVQLVLQEVKKRPAEVDWDTAEKAAMVQNGYPVNIGRALGE